jgi:hypothetical protein
MRRISVAQSKYGHYLKKLTFKDYGPGSYRQGTKMNGDFLGQGAYIQYGTYWTAGKVGKEPFIPHIHDYNQVMVWLGADTTDIGDLNAEIEICLGEEKEKQVITTASAVFIPRGLAHSPISCARMDQRFIQIEVSCAPEVKDMPVASESLSIESIPAAGWGARYRNRISHLLFERKGAWHYGPANRDDAGGSLGIVRGTAGFDFMMLIETIKKAPYRFGPDPDKPHSHPHPEILLFIGADTEDLSRLGGEAEIALGEEMERHLITAPTAVVVPGGLLHCPLTINKVTRPFILTDVRPFGHGGTNKAPE